MKLNRLKWQEWKLNARKHQENEEQPIKHQETSRTMKINDGKWK